MITRTIEFDTRKAKLNLTTELPSTIQSSLYTIRLGHDMLLNELVVYRLGYNADAYKGAN
jgi:hypothetical protein